MTEPESVLLDTSVVIAYLRGNPSLEERLRRCVTYVSVAVIGELYFGAYKSASPARNLASVREFLQICPALPIAETTAERFGAIRAELELAGSRIPENDVWIAAAAKEYGIPLATRDRHFFAVGGLQTLKW